MQDVSFSSARHPLFSLGLVLSSTLGCAAPRHVLLSTWQDETKTAVTPKTPAPTSLAYKQQSISIDRPTKAPVVSVVDLKLIDPEQIAADLEIALLHFTSELKMVSGRVKKRRQQSKRRKKPKKAKEWPKVLQLLWAKLLDELQTGLAIPPDDLLPKRVLLQAHVTTAAEKDITERAFGKCPEALAWRIKDLHQQIHQLLQRNMLAHGPKNPLPLSVGKAPKMYWPVSPQIYTSYFGFRRDPLNGARKFHTGIDLGADRGAVVSSAARGRVIHAAWAGGYGRMIVVQHIGGYQTVYAHLGKIIAAIGSKVDAGSPLGLVGSSGRSTGPHLHFELRYGGRPVDPMKLLRHRYASHSAIKETPPKRTFTKRKRTD
jgi:murein DD-endopeptidase MepM/ murein hydrolase activator NlpD